MKLLYGTGMRLMEGLRLRVKDIDFELAQISVRDTKSNRDRITMMPQSLVKPLEAQLELAKGYFERDLVEDVAGVHLPDALAKKYPGAATEWAWQYVFPSHKLSTDPRTGRTGR